MTEKEQALASIEQMPDDASFEDIVETVNFLAAIQDGLKDLDHGAAIDHEDAKRNIFRFLKIPPQGK